MLKRVWYLFFWRVWWQPKRETAVFLFFIWSIVLLWSIYLKGTWEYITTVPGFTLFSEPSFILNTIFFFWVCFGVQKKTEELRNQRRNLFLLFGEIQALDADKAKELRDRYSFLDDKDDYKLQTTRLMN